MDQRFLFDRIDAEPRGLTIAGKLNLLADSLANETKAPLLVQKLAGTWAERAQKPPVF